MTVLAAICREYGKPLSIEEIELEEPRGDEIRVRMAATGICHTDLSFINMPGRIALPFVPGHEGAGVVEKVGETVTGLSPGDHVVLSFPSCGRCPSCLKGRPFHCIDGSKLTFSGARLDGTSPIKDKNNQQLGTFFAQSSFATHSNTLARSATRIDKDLPLEIMGPLGCGILTGVGAVFNIFKPPIGASLAVFGTGPVGFGAIMGAHFAGCENIIGVDLLEDRLEFAREMGATQTLNGDKEDVLARIMALTGGGVDYAFDTTGNLKVIEQAFKSLNKNGQCAMAVAFGEEIRINPRELLLGKSIRGCVEGESVPGILIPQLISLYKSGRFPFDRMVTTFDFQNINQAIEASASGAVIKAVVTF